MNNPGMTLWAIAKELKLGDRYHVIGHGNLVFVVTSNWAMGQPCATLSCEGAGFSVVAMSGQFRKAK